MHRYYIKYFNNYIRCCVYLCILCCLYNISASQYFNVLDSNYNISYGFDLFNKIVDKDRKYKTINIGIITDFSENNAISFQAFDIGKLDDNKKRIRNTSEYALFYNSSSSTYQDVISVLGNYGIVEIHKIMNNDMVLAVDFGENGYFNLSTLCKDDCSELSDNVELKFEFGGGYEAPDNLYAALYKPDIIDEKEDMHYLLWISNKSNANKDIQHICNKYKKMSGYADCTKQISILTPSASAHVSKSDDNESCDSNSSSKDKNLQQQKVKQKSQKKQKQNQHAQSK